MVGDFDGKIYQIILNNRLKILHENIAPEHSNGFRPGRGTTDSLFIFLQTLRKRKEHNKESWVLLLDVIKAFDRVPRTYLWKTMKKMGVDPHLIACLMNLYENTTATMMVDGVSKPIVITEGTGQGSVLGPQLFAFFMLGVLKVVEQQTQHLKSGLQYKMDDKISGRNYTTEGEYTDSYLFGFADDTALIFETKENLQEGTDIIISIFEAIGLGVHTGNASQPNSKTSAMYIPANSPPESMVCVLPPPPLQSSLLLSSAPDRFVPFVHEYVYLGYKLHWSLSDEPAIRARIAASRGIFGSLRKDLLGTKQATAKVKKTVFVGMVMAMMLYGAEVWIPSARMIRALQSAFRQMVRSMMRVNLLHTRLHHIRHTDLLHKLDLHDFLWYLDQRVLGWAGHLARMPPSRLPRKALTSYLNSPRHSGGQALTHGRTLYRSLRRRKIESGRWMVEAMDREKWRAATKATTSLHLPKKNFTRRFHWPISRKEIRCKVV